MTPPRVLGSSAEIALAFVLRGLLAFGSPLVQAARKLRILRRRPAWNWLRAAALLGAGLGLIATTGWWRLACLAFALLALALAKTRDPDSDRRMQRLHRAEYFLNGGEWAGSSSEAVTAALAARTKLQLLIRDRYLLLVPQDQNGEVHRAVALADVERVLVDGNVYVPVYVSEAKQPPVREREVDRHAESELKLVMCSGETLLFVYRGAFHQHLAATAAHAIHSARNQLAG